MDAKVAPVCPVSRSQPVSNAPGNPMPAVPKALDLPSLIAAANAIRLQVLQLIGPSMVVNNVFPPRSFGYPQLKYTARPPLADWYEVDRVDEDLKVYHKLPNGNGDASQFVVVTRVDESTFRDRNTESYFEWKYGHAAPGITSAGGSASPFEEDFFQRVIDVQWGGLAVEFFPRAT